MRESRGRVKQNREGNVSESHRKYAQKDGGCYQGKWRLYQVLIHIFIVSKKTVSMVLTD